MRKILRENISRTLAGLNVDGEFEINIERPAQEENGDFSTSVAMGLARVLKKNPREIARQLVDGLGDIDGIADITIANPGFINFYLSDDELLKNSLELSKGEKDLRTKKSQPKKIVLEHTNANPNKALHLGHLRNACLGNSLERILEFIGDNVEVQYYVDDTGVQVAQTALGFRCLAMTQEEGEKFDHFAARVYVELSSKIENDQNLQDKQAEIIEALDHHNEDTSVFVKDIAKKIVQENLKTMADYGVDYDLMVWESDIIKFGFWQKAFEILKSSASFIKIEDGKNAGCYVIKDVMGDDKVIVKSNGIVTYTGKDIAYHLWKFNLLGSDFRYSDYPTDTQKKKLVSTNSDGEPSQDYGRADEVVNIVDVRQSFPQQAVMESLKSLGYQKQADNFHHVGYGVVNLSAKTAQELGVDVSSGKSSFAMSGRKGVGVFADDLLLAMKEKIKKNHPNSPCIDDIAVGAIKYYMLNYNTYSDIAFDFDRALDIYGNSGPYIQYTHARCQSVLDKVSDVETDLDRDAGVELGLIESELLRSLYHFDEAANASGAQYAPNILSNYLFELAKRFNHFYATCPIANCEDQQLKKIRIIICKSSQLILKTGLELLGITAPDKM